MIIFIFQSPLKQTYSADQLIHCISHGYLHTSLLAVPGVPQMITATEMLRPCDNICIILVTWDPPANSNGSDIDQYIVYVPSRNIGNNISNNIITLTVSNCDDDIHVQVAAVNRDGCEGMNSSEVLPVPLPTAPATTESGSAMTTEEGSSTITEGGSTFTSSKHLEIINLFNLCLAFPEDHHAYTLLIAYCMVGNFRGC